jgi:pyrroloquinoline quinone biosynthesis protein B
MHLGREAMGASSIPVYAMPRMKTFLQENGPWSQLVSLKNIVLHDLKNEVAVELEAGIKVIPILVPHRDEFSETVGFRIEGPNRSALFIPDIDKWGKWDRDIREEVKAVDIAFLDATFYENGEIPGRDMLEIPHPFVAESMALLADLPENERKKVHFIHFNHTNPLLDANSESRREVKEAGFQIAEEGMRFPL